MNILNVAIAMSVYKSDTSKNLKLAIDSILNQTYKNIDFFLEVDGYIDKDLRALLTRYNATDNLFITFNPECKGLATRLNTIIERVIISDKYEFISRMDADDISFPDRIETQVEFLKNNPDISVVGTDLIEISDTGEEFFHKKMHYKHKDIFNNVIKKCPFSHPTVMFRTSVFRDSNIRYKSELMNTQDYYLWVDLLAAGHKFANIDIPLLYFRVNDDFHSRRGFGKALNDFRSRLYAFKHLNVFTFSNVLHTILLVLLRVSPSSIKSMAYKNLR